MHRPPGTCVGRPRRPTATCASPNRAWTPRARGRRGPDAGLADTLAQTGLLERLADAWRERLDQTGRLDLWDLLRELLPSHSDEELFLLAGDLLVWMLDQGEPLPPQGWQWRPLGRRLEVQNLVVMAQQAGANRDGR
jgi:hypothetical protein